MTKEEYELIKGKQKEGKVVFRNVEGLMAQPIEDFCSQCVEGLLYDLNRDEATTLTLNDNRCVNDLAVAQVIRYLHKKVYGE